MDRQVLLVYGDLKNGYEFVLATPDAKEVVDFIDDYLKNIEWQYFEPKTIEEAKDSLGG